MSINPDDGLYRSGVLASEDGAFEKSFLPAITGTDFAGIVEATSKEVAGFDVGDRVFGTGLADNPGATVAEYATIPADHAAKLPSGIEVYLTGRDTLPNPVSRWIARSGLGLVDRFPGLGEQKVELYAFGLDPVSVAVSTFEK